MAKPRASHRAALLSLAAAASGVLLLASLYLTLLGPAPVASQEIGGPFRLTASDGRLIDERSFPNRFTLLYFGYSHCRDVCPTTLAALGQALDLLGAKASLVQPLFVSLDPARDSPAVLRGYLALVSPRVLGLTGTAEQLAAMQRAFRVTSVPHSDGSLDLDHGSVLYLMAPDGHFVRPIPADAPPRDLAATLARTVG